MGFSAIDQLIARGTPSPITSGLQGIQAGEQMIPNIQMARLAPLLRRAQITSEQAKAKALPYQALGSYFGGLGKFGQTSLSSNPSYILARMINSPALLAMASKDKKFARNLGTTMQQLGQQSAQQGLPDQSIMQQAVGQGTEDPQATYNQLMPPAHHAQNEINQDNAPIIQHTQNANDWTDKDVSIFQQALNDALLKKTTTANIMNQRQYAGTLDNLFNRASPLMSSVSQYAGFRGKTQKGLAAFASSFGAISPAYQNYLNFTRSLAPLVANEMRRTLGGQATDKESAIMDAIVDPTYWDSNPTAALKQWNFLVNTYRGSVNPALMASPSKVVNRFGNKEPFVARTQENKAIASQAQPRPATGIIRVRLPDGREGNVPASNLDKAIKMGAKRI